MRGKLPPYLPIIHHPSLKFMKMKPAGLLLLFTAITLAACQAERSNRCVVESRWANSNGTEDDSPAIAAAFANCSSDAVIEFPLGVDYRVLTPIDQWNLNNVEILMQGNLHLPENITYVQEIVNGSGGNEQAGNLYWFTLHGSYIDWIGTPNVTTGWIRSYGQQWWDTNPVNGTGAVARPHLMELNVTDSTFTYLKSWKPIAWGTKLLGNNITLDHPVVEATSSGSFPFNTDGLDVGASNVAITNGQIYNGDDAIAIQSGAHNVLFQNNVIGFETHGMSVGSLGQNQADYANVSNIRFDNNVVSGGLYAARFKSWIGGQGLARNITWSNNRLYNVTFPIQVTQRYSNQGSAQTQLYSGATSGRPNNSSVVLENITFANFTGSMNSFHPGDGSCVTDPCWYNAGYDNLTQTETIIIECNQLESCSNITFSNIEVTPQNSLPATQICVSVDSDLNPDLGFDCTNGTYIPTI